VCSVTQQVCSAPQQVCSASNEVSSGSRGFTCGMNTTLSEAVTTTFASDEPFLTTEQVTSVAEEIIGDVPVMSLSTINKQTERTGAFLLFASGPGQLAADYLYWNPQPHFTFTCCECSPGLPHF